LGRALRGVDLTLETLEQCLTITRDKLFEPGAKYDSTLASHAAWVGKHLIQIAEAARKLEATTDRRAKNLTPEQQFQALCASVKELPKERLADLLALIQELNPVGSVL
jgi:hypothetical protein